MKWNVTTRTPAKINLHLHVYPVREDGFHDLKSLFVMVSLYDELRLSSADHGNCLIRGFEGIPREDNLIWKAWHSYGKAAGDYVGINVICNKHIPPMSGLGGGSSDAAAVLKSLDLIARRQGRTHLGSDVLRRIAEGLGSDVPFFLNGPAALAEGRGELLTPVEVPKEYPLVLVRPDPDVSTIEAYRRLDEEGVDQRKDCSTEELKRNFLEKSPAEWFFYNSFTPVISRQYPEIKSLIDYLYQKGAGYAEMSGSGSAVFGVFSEDEKAQKATEGLKKERQNVWKLKMLALPPEAVYNESRLK